jgi:hypothetical protein
VRWSADGTPLPVAIVDAAVVGPAIALTPIGLVFTTFDPESPGPDHQRLAAWSDSADRTLARITRLPYRSADFPTCGLRNVTISPLFSPELVWAARKTHLVVVATSEYVVGIYRDGQLRTSVRRPIESRQVTETMALRQVAEGVRVGSSCTIPPSEIVRGRGFAKALAAVAAIAISPIGEIWVLRGRLADEPSRIDVFSNLGEYQGTLPPGTPFPAAFDDNDRMYAIEEDSLHTPLITAYTIHR